MNCLLQHSPELQYTSTDKSSTGTYYVNPGGGILQFFPGIEPDHALVPTYISGQGLNILKIPTGSRISLCQR
jgi:hypothetical protein